MLMEPEQTRAMEFEDQMKTLPKVVEDWLKKVGVTEGNRIRSVKFMQTGEMRLKAEQSKPFQPKAKQLTRVDEPAYLWEVNLAVIPLIDMKGRDLFYQGIGAMEMRLGSVIPVVNERDKEKLNESSLHRFLLEIPWYPTAALEEYMTWKARDDHSAEGTIHWNGMKAKGTFFFDDKGFLEKIETLRYKESDLKAERIPCIGTFGDYQFVQGLKIPYQADVTWHLKGKDFTWYKIRNYDMAFSFFSSLS